MASAAAPVAPVEAPSAAALFRGAMGAVQAGGANGSFEVCVLRACFNFWDVTFNFSRLTFNFCVAGPNIKS